MFPLRAGQSPSLPGRRVLFGQGFHLTFWVDGGGRPGRWWRKSTRRSTPTGIGLIGSQVRITTHGNGRGRTRRSGRSFRGGGEAGGDGAGGGGLADRAGPPQPRPDRPPRPGAERLPQGLRREGVA